MHQVPFAYMVVFRQTSLEPGPSGPKLSAHSISQPWGVHVRKRLARISLLFYLKCLFYFLFETLKIEEWSALLLLLLKGKKNLQFLNFINTEGSKRILNIIVCLKKI